MTDQAPREWSKLFDTASRQRIALEIGARPEHDLRFHPDLAYLKGMIETGDAAISWLQRAQALVGSSDEALSGRITLELGFLCLQRSRFETAEAVLASGEARIPPGRNEPADVTHLRALIADRRGDYSRAAKLYRETIRRAATALTPMTEALAMKNLAVALHHRRPDESVALCELALATVEGADLHRSIVPAIENAMGYAYICCGDLQSAHKRLASAAAGGGDFEASLSIHFARFNDAIVTELLGDAQAADAQLAAVEATPAVLTYPEFLGWIHVRRAWLAFRQGKIAEARSRLRREFGDCLQEPYRDSVETVEALVAIATGDSQAGRRHLGSLIERLQEKGDDLTAMTLLLWLALLEHRVGRVVAATHAVRRAHEIGRVGGFRISPNWWMAGPIATARVLGGQEMAPFFDQLIEPRDEGDGPAAAAVVVHPDGTFDVSGKSVPLSIWREGRSGSGVLMRLFRALARSRGSGLRREVLCDLLWPESDGDRARRNLYAATNDLRKVLSAIPGLRLETDGAFLRLGADPNVIFEREGTLAGEAAG